MSEGFNVRIPVKVCLLVESIGVSVDAIRDLAGIAPCEGGGLVPVERRNTRVFLVM